MSNWKSFKRKAQSDQHIDWVPVECYWKYQTTADVFSYHEVSEKTDEYMGVKEGKPITNVFLGHDEAIRMYHALSNWIGQYESEEAQKKAIDNNMFAYDEKLDS